MAVFRFDRSHFRLLSSVLQTLKIGANDRSAQELKMIYRTGFILMFWLWYGHLKILQLYKIKEYLVTLYNTNICNQKECFR